MAKVTTTLVVQFADPGGGILTAEVDNRPDGFNGDKTSFAPGDSPIFLLFKTPDVTVDAIISTYVDVVAITPIAPLTYLYDVEEWLTFADTTQAFLSKPYYSDLEYQWYGRNLGVLTPRNGAILAEHKGVGVAKVKYKSLYTPYAIPSPLTMNGKTSFEILVFIKGHTDDA